MIACMTMPRAFHAFVAIIFGTNAVVAGGLALWLDLTDGNYLSSVELTILGLFSGLVAVKAWKRCATGLN
jgi:hypothetical protein